MLSALDQHPYLAFTKPNNDPWDTQVSLQVPKLKYEDTEADSAQIKTACGWGGGTNDPRRRVVQRDQRLWKMARRRRLRSGLYDHLKLLPMGRMVQLVGRYQSWPVGVCSSQYGCVAELVLLDVEDWEFDGIGILAESVLAL